MTTTYKCTTCAAECNGRYSLCFKEIIAFGQTEKIAEDEYFCAPWCRILRLRHSDAEIWDKSLPDARVIIASMKIAAERGIREGKDKTELISVMFAIKANVDFWEKIMTGTMTCASIKALAYEARRIGGRAMEKIEEGSGDSNVYDYVTRIVKEMTAAIDDGNYGHWATDWAGED